MPGSLEGPIAKLARAASQVGVLQSQIHADWPPGKAWPVRREVDRAGLEYRFYLGDLPEVDPQWALLTGEILFNLRSALDHLAFELHVRRYRGRVPIKVENTIQFPICVTPAKWRDNGKSRIKELAERERQAIRNLQPYQALRDKWAFVRSDLGVLDELHIVDKHRQLHLIAGSQGGAVLMGDSYAPEFGFRQTTKWGRVEAHAHVETWTFAKRPPKIQSHLGAFLEVTLDRPDGMTYGSLVPLLTGLTSSVALVVRRFKRLFPPMTMPGTPLTDRWWSGNDPGQRFGSYLG